MAEFVITKDMYSELGAYSLQGMLFNVGITKESKVTLVFQTSSTAYCYKNNGPELLIVPDFVFVSLAESLIKMAKDGWDIEVKEQPVD